MNDLNLRLYKVRLGVKVLGKIIRHKSDEVYEFTPVNQKGIVLYIAKNDLPYSVCSDRLDKMLMNIRMYYSDHSEDLFNLLN